jgi:hypothetical protein
MNRRAMTLVEMLVATTATLILIAAVAQAFAVFGSAITGSRGVLDLDARMRSAAWRLRSDLAGITVSPLPPITPESAQGYLEIIEGPSADHEDFTGVPLAANAAVGPTDVDDVLLFTTQSTNPSFVGRAPNGRTFESTVAEVAWFARRTPTPNPSADNPPTFTLYRRQLLVVGYMGVEPFSTNPGSNNSVTWGSWPSGTGSWKEFYNWPCDVSVRREGTTLVPNTLADLSRRESRFLHNTNGVIDGTAFPYAFVAHQAATAPDGLIFAPGTSRQGEDVVLTDVVAFDVRVFDPAAAVQLPGSTPLVPGDPSFVTASSGTATGAYVDLDHGGINNSLIPAAVTPYFKSSGLPVGSSTATLPPTYDTWTLAYEANGRNEDDDWSDTNSNGVRDPGEDIVDDAFDGRDNDGKGLIDDSAEFETRPPYPYPLRGIEVRIRCYEPSSRQVRQVTVRHTFVPH